MSERKVVCWDLDETLGNFRRIYHKEIGERPCSLDPENSLQYGLVDALKYLSSTGYEHVVTTATEKPLALKALEKSGIGVYFSHVFGPEVVSSGFGGKQYLDVAKTVGFCEEQAIESMIVIGNAYGDKPVDLDGLVFVEHKQSVLTDAAITTKIFSVLQDLGNGNFNAGYVEMCEAAEKRVRDYGNGFVSESTVYTISPGVELVLKYESNSKNGSVGEDVVPTVTVLRDSSLRVDPVLF